MIRKLKYDKDNNLYNTQYSAENKNYDLLNKPNITCTEEFFFDTEKFNLIDFKPDNYALRVLENEKDNFGLKKLLTGELNVLPGTKGQTCRTDLYDKFRQFVQHGIKSHLTAQTYVLKALMNGHSAGNFDFDLIKELFFSAKCFEFATDSLLTESSEFKSLTMSDKKQTLISSLINASIKNVSCFFEQKNQKLITDICDFYVLCNETLMIKSFSAILFHLIVRTDEHEKIYLNTFRKNSSYIIEFSSNARFPDKNIFENSPEFDSVFSNTGLVLAKETVENLNGKILANKDKNTKIIITIPAKSLDR